MEHSRAQKDQKAEEARVFGAFLEAFPSLKATVASWAPEEDFPDILCYLQPSGMIGFELGEWLNERQIQERKLREKMEEEILSAIGEQGKNTTKHIQRVQLKLKKTVKRFDHRDSKKWSVPLVGLAGTVAYVETSNTQPPPVKRWCI